MMEPALDEAKIGVTYLVYDPNDDILTWALWHRSGAESVRVLVNWSGVVREPPIEEREEWHVGDDPVMRSRFVLYELTAAQTDAFVMLAHHSQGHGAWNRFCERWVTNH
jgi:hypothetical protein